MNVKQLCCLTLNFKSIRKSCNEVYCIFMLSIRTRKKLVSSVSLITSILLIFSPVALVYGYKRTCKYVKRFKTSFTCSFNMFDVSVYASFYLIFQLSLNLLSFCPNYVHPLKCKMSRLFFKWPSAFTSF